MVRHIFFLIAAALVFALGCQKAMAQGGGDVSLAQLEDWARSFAPVVELARAEVAVAQQRSMAYQAREGARVFGGAGVVNAREAVTDTLSRDYTRPQAELGVRWPILGSRASQQRIVEDAQYALAQSQLRRLQSENEAVLALQRAYVRHLRSAERVRITQAFLSVRADVQKQLEQRRGAGVLLEADRLDLMGLFDIVQTAHDDQRSAQKLARAEVARLTGQPAVAVPTHELQWPEVCFQERGFDLDKMPSVVLAQLEFDASRSRQQSARLEGLEAGISVSQALSRDIGGPSGRSTRVGVDFSMPLQWQAQRDAALAQAQSEIDRAQALLVLRRSEAEAAREQALAQYELRSKEMAGFRHRQRAALEALRVAQLRLDAFDGDGYSKLLMARYALYQAAMQVADGAQRRDLAALEVLSLHNGCTLASADTFTDVHDSWAAVLASLSSAALPVVPAPEPDHGVGLGWYVWKGRSMLTHPQQLDDLPVESRRVLLSFTDAELRALTQPMEQKQLQDFIAAAHGRRLQVELLLGEPTWVLPQQRGTLLALIDALRDLPFDALHLDLERSQLPVPQQRSWIGDLMDTLREVHKRSPWPIALTTNYRELRQPDFAARVHAAGVREIVAMLYVSDVNRAAAIARELLRGPAGLRLSLAQSIEPGLSAQESSYAAGRAASLARWRELARRLMSVSGFNGIVVQSWEDYQEARP
ncbi:MAG: TolC family protein [Pseudomonadota bacterium]